MEKSGKRTAESRQQLRFFTSINLLGQPSLIFRVSLDLRSPVSPVIFTHRDYVLIYCLIGEINAKLFVFDKYVCTLKSIRTFGYLLQNVNNLIVILPEFVINE